MTDIYDGDPKIYITEDGADLHFSGGQCVMDAGLENAANISLFTKKSWCGNILFQDNNQKIGSDFEDIANQEITVGMINDLRNAAEKALEWMVTSGLAINVVASVTNPRADRLEVAVLIEPPGKDPLILLATRHGNNWINQKIDPAYLKGNS